jgi:hypothetical protein
MLVADAHAPAMPFFADAVHQSTEAMVSELAEGEGVASAESQQELLQTLELAPPCPLQPK